MTPTPGRNAGKDTLLVEMGLRALVELSLVVHGEAQEAAWVGRGSLVGQDSGGVPARPPNWSGLPGLRGQPAIAFFAALPIS